MTEESGRDRWQRAYDQAKKRDADFTTLSGLPVEPVYGPPDGTEPAEEIGWPGEFPFTRGLYPTGYRGRTWTIRQFAGFGVREIAAQLKKPEGTIKADLYHARAKLKEALAEREARRATGPHPVQGRGSVAGTPGNESRGKRRSWGRTDAS